MALFEIGTEDETKILKQNNQALETNTMALFFSKQTSIII